MILYLIILKMFNYIAFSLVWPKVSKIDTLRYFQCHEKREIFQTNQITYRCNKKYSSGSINNFQHII